TVLGELASWLREPIGAVPVHWPLPPSQFSVVVAYSVAQRAVDWRRQTELKPHPEKSRQRAVLPLPLISEETTVLRWAPPGALITTDQTLAAAEQVQAGSALVQQTLEVAARLSLRSQPAVLP